MPILIPTWLARSTGVSSWKLPVMHDDSPIAFIINIYYSLPFSQQF